MRRRGLLIALEGIDGAGKSTLHRGLAAALRAEGLSVRRRREPTDRKIGALAQAASVDDPWTGAVYFTVDRHRARADLERDLGRYDVVLTDRSFYSTLAYQGSALSPGDRRRLERLELAATVRPDRVILLDLPARVAVARLGARTSARGPLERRRTLERVARSYRTLARSGAWVVLDATRPADELRREALARLGVPRRTPARRSTRARTRAPR